VLYTNVDALSRVIVEIYALTTTSVSTYLHSLQIIYEDIKSPKVKYFLRKTSLVFDVNVFRTIFKHFNLYTLAEGIMISVRSLQRSEGV